MLYVTQNDGRDGRYFDCRTTRPFRREAAEFDIIETVISGTIQPAMTKSTLV